MRKCCDDSNAATDSATSFIAGFRGGFIFPTFFAGTAFGHAVWRTMNAIPGTESWFGSMPPVLFCMTMAVGEPLRVPNLASVPSSAPPPAVLEGFVQVLRWLCQTASKEEHILPA